MKQPAVYIMANRKNGALYVGVTSHIARRAYEHKNKSSSGFTSKYKCNLLVFYEFLETMEGAIAREKQLKGRSRAQKVRLIEEINPTWQDLYETCI